MVGLWREKFDDCFSTNQESVVPGTSK